MIKHPAVAIVLFPLFAAPLLILTARTSPDWIDGQLAQVDALMWSAVASIYLAFVIWTATRTIRHRSSRSKIVKAALDKDQRIVPIGPVDLGPHFSRLHTSGVPRAAWLVLEPSSRRAMIHWRNGSDIKTRPLAGGVEISGLSLTDRSYSPGSTPELAMRFADGSTTEVQLRGPYSGIFPPTVTSAKRLVDRAWREFQAA